MARRQGMTVFPLIGSKLLARVSNLRARVRMATRKQSPVRSPHSWPVPLCRFTKMGSTPACMRNAVVLLLYKDKGYRYDLKNYRRIAVANAVGTIASWRKPWCFACARCLIASSHQSRKRSKHINASPRTHNLCKTSSPTAIMSNRTVCSSSVIKTQRTRELNRSS